MYSLVPETRVSKRGNELEKTISWVVGEPRLSPALDIALFSEQLFLNLSNVSEGINTLGMNNFIRKQI